MKKLLILFAFIPLLILAQNGNKAIVELFVFSQAPEYDSILKIMDQGGYDFVAYHDNRGDTLECKDVIRLMDLRLTFMRPCAFVNGHQIENYQVLDPAIYQQTVDRTELYNDNLQVIGKWINMQKPDADLLSVQINCNATGIHIMAMITESFPNTRYRNVLRSLLIDTFYTGGKIDQIFPVQPNWISENCKLLVIAETIHGQILSCRYIPFQNYYTGTEAIETPIRVYPNPCTDIINIESDQPLSFIRIINSKGSILHTQTTNDYQYQYPMNNLPNGLYIIQANGKTFRIIKQ
jgi:hypothetical protein